MEKTKQGTTKIRAIPKHGTDKTRSYQNTERPNHGMTKTRTRDFNLPKIAELKIINEKNKTIKSPSLF